MPGDFPARRWIVYARLKRALAGAGRHLRAPQRPGPTLITALGAGLLSIGVVFSLGLILHLAVLTAYFWVPSFLLQCLNVSSARSRLERALTRPAQLDRLTVKRLEGHSIVAAIIPGAIEKRLYRDALFLSISAVLLIAATVGLAVKGSSGTLDDLSWGPWPVNGRIALTLSMVLTAGLFVWIQHWLRPHHRLRSAVAQAIHSTLAPLNHAIALAMAQHDTSGPETKMLEQRLGIAHGPGSLETAVMLLKAGLDQAFERAGDISTELQNAVQEAQVRKKELQSALLAYRCACDSIDAVASLFAAIPSALTRELQACRATLDHADVKELLVTGNWPAYRLILSTVQARIDILPDVAAAMVRPPSAAASVPMGGETELEKAFCILRLPPKASPDEVRRAYRWLSTMWHPDRRLSSDDTEIKRINWAYAYLRAAELSAHKAK